MKKKVQEEKFLVDKHSSLFYFYKDKQFYLNW
jgi:hypothetical protein